MAKIGMTVHGKDGDVIVIGSGIYPITAPIVFPANVRILERTLHNYVVRGRNVDLADYFYQTMGVEAEREPFADGIHDDTAWVKQQVEISRGDCG